MTITDNMAQTYEGVQLPSSELAVVYIVTLAVVLVAVCILVVAVVVLNPTVEVVVVVLVAVEVVEVVVVDFCIGGGGSRRGGVRSQGCGS